MNPLAAIPPKVRVAFYLLYALAGPVLIYTAEKGWTGQPEFRLWVGIGSAFGITAAANVARARRRIPVEDVPHEPVIDVALTIDPSTRVDGVFKRGGDRPQGGVWGGA